MKKIIFLPLILIFFAFQLNAKSWHIESLHISAQVRPDGSMQVSETRRYQFRGHFHWADYQLPNLENQTIKNFKLRDDQQTYLQNESEQEGSYYLETVANQFYVKWFYDVSNESKTFYLDYTITDAVQRYEDVAELYWKFIGEKNPTGVDTTSIIISLPKDASYGDVKAWAHGPLWGEILFTNKHILLTIGKLPEQRFVEARVIFPPEWVPGSTQLAGTKQKQISDEEKKFAEQANKQREQALIEQELQREKNEKVSQIASPLAIFSLLIFAFMFWRYGRGFDVNYNQHIDANIPKDNHPALLNCIYFHKNITGSTLSTALFNLAKNGLLTIEKNESRQKKWYENSEPVILKVDRGKWQNKRDDLYDFEDDLLDFLFNTLANGGNEVTSKMMKKASSKMQKWFRHWQKMIKANLKEEPYFEQESIKGAILNGVINLVIVVISIILLVNYGENALLALLPSVLFCVLSPAILRYMPETKLLKRKLSALRRYLKTFGTTSYQQSDLHNISDYFLFSIVLGVGKKSVEKLMNVVPEDQHALLFPWYVYAGSGGPADFASAISSVVNAAATSVSSAAGAGGGMAAGGGGGGGGAAGGAG